MSSDDMRLAITRAKNLMDEGSDEEALSELKRNNVPVNYMRDGFKPLITVAAECGSTLVVQWLIDGGADIIETNKGSEAIWTPFINAVLLRQTKAMALLYHYEKQLIYNPYAEHTAAYLVKFYENTKDDPESRRSFQLESERLAKENPRLPPETIERLRVKYSYTEAKSPTASAAASIAASRDTLFGSRSPLRMDAAKAGAGAGSPKEADTTALLSEEGRAEKAAQASTLRQRYK